MPNFIRFTPEKLNSVSLSVLREIARQIGVKAPSSKSVPALISEIILIQRGDLAPVKSNRGARSKPVDISAYYEVEYEFPQEECVDYVPTPIEPLILRDGNVIDEDGLYQRASDGTGYLRGTDFSFLSSDAVIPDEIVEKYDLRPGDYVKAKVVPYDNKKVVRELTVVNDKPANNHIQFMDFADLQTFYVDELMELKGSPIVQELMQKAPIHKGQRAVIAVPSNVDKSTLTIELANAINESNSNFMTLVLMVGANREDIDEVKRATGVKVVSTRVDADYDVQIGVSELLIECAKRGVEHGKDVVVIINSITNLVKAYMGDDVYGADVLTKIAPALMGVKRMLASALKTARADLTILAIMDYSNSQFDTIVFNEINRVANMRAVLTTQDTVDEKLSFTKKYVTANKGTNNEQ